MPSCGRCLPQMIRDSCAASATMPRSFAGAVMPSPRWTRWWTAFTSAARELRPEEIGSRALAAALSDLAAMGVDRQRAGVPGARPAQRIGPGTVTGADRRRRGASAGARRDDRGRRRHRSADTDRLVHRGRLGRRPRRARRARRRAARRPGRRNRVARWLGCRVWRWSKGARTCCSRNSPTCCEAAMRHPVRVSPRAARWRAPG